jgi:hypothetical protein
MTREQCLSDVADTGLSVLLTTTNTWHVYSYKAERVLPGPLEYLHCARRLRLWGL